MIRSAINAGIGFWIGCIVFGLISDTPMIQSIGNGFFGFFAVVWFAYFNHKKYIKIDEVKNENAQINP